MPTQSVTPRLHRSFSRKWRPKPSKVEGVVLLVHCNALVSLPGLTLMQLLLSTNADVNPEPNTDSHADADTDAVTTTDLRVMEARSLTISRPLPTLIGLQSAGFLGGAILERTDYAVLSTLFAWSMVFSGCWVCFEASTTTLAPTPELNPRPNPRSNPTLNANPNPNSNRHPAWTLTRVGK